MNARIKVVILAQLLAACAALAACARENVADSTEKSEQEVTCDSLNEHMFESLNDSITSLRASLNDLKATCDSLNEQMLESLNDSIKSLNKRITDIESGRNEADEGCSGSPLLISVCALLLSVVALLTSVVTMLRSKKKKRRPSEKEPPHGEEGSVPNFDFGNFNRGGAIKSTTNKKEEQESEGGEQEQETEKAEECKDADSQSTEPEDAEDVKASNQPAKDADSQSTEPKDAEDVKPSNQTAKDSDSQSTEPKAAEDVKASKDGPVSLYKAYFVGNLLTANGDGDYLINEDSGTFSYSKDLSAINIQNQKGAVKRRGFGSPVRQKEGTVKIKTPGKAWFVVDPVIVEFKELE